MIRVSSTFLTCQAVETRVSAVWQKVVCALAKEIKSLGKWHLLQWTTGSNTLQSNWAGIVNVKEAMKGFKPFGTMSTQRKCSTILLTISVLKLSVHISIIASVQAHLGARQLHLNLFGTCEQFCCKFRRLSVARAHDILEKCCSKYAPS